MEILISGMSSQFQGIGRDQEGRAVFVPGALPGERVRVEPLQDKGSFLKARLEAVLEPSPHRVKPPCPYAGACGGCAGLHMDYPATLDCKTQRVADALERLGGIAQPPVAHTLGMPQGLSPFRSRNKAEYAIEGGRVGLRREGSRQLVEVEDCLIQGEKSVAALRVARQWLRETPPFSGWLVTRLTRSGALMCVLSAPVRPKGLEKLGERLFAQAAGMASFYFCQLRPHPAHALDGRCQWIRGERTLTDTLMGLSFQLQPQSFFQVNPPQAEALYAAALDMAQLRGGGWALDAYCGAGTITLCLAQGAGRVLGVEVVPQAVEDAKANARRNGLEDKADFLCADAAQALPRLLQQGDAPQAVVLDPPRKGAAPALLDALVRSPIPRIVYISCDPATLARDLKRLSPAYRLLSAQPIDMFPWSSHVETAALLSKTNTEQHI